MSVSVCDICVYVSDGQKRQSSSEMIIKKLKENTQFGRPFSLALTSISWLASQSNLISAEELNNNGAGMDPSRVDQSAQREFPEIPFNAGSSRVSINGNGGEQSILPRAARMLIETRLS